MEQTHQLPILKFLHINQAAYMQKPQKFQSWG